MINSQYNQCPSNTLTPPSKQTNTKQGYSDLASPALGFGLAIHPNSRQTQTDRRQEAHYDLSYSLESFFPPLNVLFYPFDLKL